MNIRKKPSLETRSVVAVYKKNALVEVVQFCDGWLKIKCAEADWCRICPEQCGHLCVHSWQDLYRCSR